MDSKSSVEEKKDKEKEEKPLITYHHTGGAGCIVSSDICSKEPLKIPIYEDTDVTESNDVISVSQYMLSYSIKDKSVKFLMRKREDLIKFINKLLDKSKEVNFELSYNFSNRLFLNKSNWFAAIDMLVRGDYNKKIFNPGYKFQVFPEYLNYCSPLFNRYIKITRSCPFSAQEYKLDQRLKKIEDTVLGKQGDEEDKKVEEEDKKVEEVEKETRACNIASLVIKNRRIVINLD